MSLEIEMTQMNRFDDLIKRVICEFTDRDDIDAQVRGRPMNFTFLYIYSNFKNLTLRKEKCTVFFWATERILMIQILNHRRQRRRLCHSDGSVAWPTLEGTKRQNPSIRPGHASL